MKMPNKPTNDKMTQPTKNQTLFSPCRQWRYALWTDFTDHPQRVCNFLMLNPSTADEHKNDPTVERCERRARAWGYDRLVVTNIFAWRATNPRQLHQVPDPTGAENDHHILHQANQSEIIICAWGASHAKLNQRSAHVLTLLQTLDRPIHCLRKAANGEPCHPLYLPYRLSPSLFKNHSATNQAIRHI